MTTARPPDAAARSGQGPAASGGPAAFLRSALALDLRSLALFRVLLGSILIADALCRAPDAPLTLALSRGQFLSLFLLAIGLGFLITAMRRPAWAPKFRK